MHRRISETLSIGQAAKLSGIAVHTLRYWEKEFDQFLKPARTDGGQRRYVMKDLEMVGKIKRLLHEEQYTIAGAKTKLQREAAAQMRP